MVGTALSENRCPPIVGASGDNDLSELLSSLGRSLEAQRRTIGRLAMDDLAADVDNLSSKISSSARPNGLQAGRPRSKQTPRAPPPPPSLQAQPVPQNPSPQEHMAAELLRSKCASLEDTLGRERALRASLESRLEEAEAAARDLKTEARERELVLLRAKADRDTLRGAADKDRAELQAQVAALLRRVEEMAAERARLGEEKTAEMGSEVKRFAELADKWRAQAEAGARCVQQLNLELQQEKAKQLTAGKEDDRHKKGGDGQNLLQVGGSVQAATADKDTQTQMMQPTADTHHHHQQQQQIKALMEEREGLKREITLLQKRADDYQAASEKAIEDMKAMYKRKMERLKKPE